jgi:hypothetical protein
VTLRARWVTLRARWVTLRARWVTLRARWVTRAATWRRVVCPGRSMDPEKYSVMLRAVEPCTVSVSSPFSPSGKNGDLSASRSACAQSGLCFKRPYLSCLTRPESACGGLV